MPRIVTKLIARNEVAEGTMAFALDRPTTFDFRAGQYMVVVLPNPPHTDAEGNRRVFSIASPPQDTTRLLLATRMTGTALKRSLAEVPVGTPVDLSGPAGDFVLHEDASRPAVFIAGGIGITPFRSMVQDAVSRHLPHQITLIYSNRTPEGAAFHEEFTRLAQTHENLTYVPTMTQADKARQPWGGERRHVSADFLRSHIAKIATSMFYLAGPPGLVAGITKAVSDAGVDPAHVRSEEFAGY
ncbi:MAG TPA: FAD-dependent oxidoreductase [Candidatus Methylomirabilis sp.]